MIYLFVLLPVPIAWAIRYLFSLHSNLQKYDDIYSQRQINGDNVQAHSDLMEKLRLLYLHGKIKNLYFSEDYLSFEDAGLLNLVWNVYYLRFSKPGTIYYRGYIMKYRPNRKSLNAIIAYFAM